MRNRAAHLTLVLLAALVAALALPVALSAQAPKQAPNTAANTATPPCGDLVAFQVLLDRQGFSSGQIDGVSGGNFTHALAALLSARGLPPEGLPNCATWKALAADPPEPALVDYTVTLDDMKGPFETKIPASLEQQARLATLGYQSVAEELAERFHTSPALLRQLNPGVGIMAGRVLRGPAVTPFDADTNAAAGAATAGVSILVSTDDSALRVLAADGSTLFYAPVTTGSTHDPLPVGNYTVATMRWRPTFRYNPLLFWDAREGDEKATVKPGPNNPVGIVWIGLSLENYGLHGTPEPARVGHSESHGCVRLTNWDAARVAALVKPGTPVEFR
jgi:lipoprotein-anchoring transpeptidase ErfK/SrfK